MVDREQVEKVIKEDIAPKLESHGGGIELVSVEEDGTVKVRLSGACQGCPGAIMTLQGVVDELLRQAGLDIKEVAAV